MKPVHAIRGTLLPLNRVDVDTDQIMPKQFLSRIERVGFGDFVFYEWRQDPDFIFNDARFRNAKIMVAGRNFGSGSSREHAVWGLQQYGLEAIIAPSFSDIFAGNCTQMGLLTVKLPEAECTRLMLTALEEPQTEVTINLEERTVRSDSRIISFDIDDDSCEALLSGLDNIDLMLTHAAEISAYEEGRPSWLPNTRKRTVTNRA